jgi:hypothetical protein
MSNTSADFRRAVQRLISSSINSPLMGAPSQSNT